MRTLITFDYNNLAHRCAHLSQTGRSADARAWSLLSYMVFNGMWHFLQEVTEFMDAGDAADVVLALDSREGYWRRDIYPPYKADRARRREEDGIDWPRAYEEFDRLSRAIADHTPWKVIRVAGCEADDVIYSLTRAFDGPVIIHSGDSDYLQLVSDRVSLYSPHAADYVEFPRVCRIAGGEAYCATPQEYLLYAILTGQGGKDNVYNVKTPADWDAACGKRKPGFGVKAAERLIARAGEIPLENALAEAGILDGYLRNRRLIDMRELPENLENAIVAAWKDAPAREPDMAGLLSVFDWPSLRGQEEEMDERLRLWSGGIVERQPVDAPRAPEEDVCDFVL